MVTNANEEHEREHRITLSLSGLACKCDSMCVVLFFHFMCEDRFIFIVFVFDVRLAIVEKSKGVRSWSVVCWLNSCRFDKITYTFLFKINALYTNSYIFKMTHISLNIVNCLSNMNFDMSTITECLIYFKIIMIQEIGLTKQLTIQ